MNRVPHTVLLPQRFRLACGGSWCCDEFVEVDMPPLLETTPDLSRNGNFSHLSCSRSSVSRLPPFLPDFGHVLLVFSPPISLGQTQQSVPVLSLVLSFGGAALGQLPSLFSDGFNVPFRWLRRLGVLSENLPDFFLLEPFLFQDDFCFFAHFYNSRRLSARSILVPLSTLLRHFYSSRLCQHMFLACPAFFGALLPPCIPFLDVQSCSMASFCDDFPPRHLFTLFGPQFLGAWTVSACHLFQSSKCPTCAFLPACRTRRAFVGHGSCQQRGLCSAAFPAVRWRSGRRSSSHCAPGCLFPASPKLSGSLSCPSSSLSDRKSGLPPKSPFISNSRLQTLHSCISPASTF